MQNKLLLSLSVFLIGVAANLVPEQVHISFGEDPTSQMHVMWVTKEGTPKSAVEYGIAPNRLVYRVFGTNWTFVDGGEEHRAISMHKAKLTNLKPGTTYYYHCGDPDEGWSDVFSFSTLAINNLPLQIAVFGDMGTENARSLARIQEETVQGHFDFAVHVGDFAYDFDTDNGRNGDQYMRNIEPVAANLPYMVCPGNHEQAYNFSHYRNRFTMPDESSGTNIFFSYNVQNIHFVAFSTEAYFYYPDQFIENQYNWLIQDLTEANNNRDKQPWIIMYAHRPLYCSDIALTPPRKLLEDEQSFPPIPPFTDCGSDADKIRLGINGSKWGIEELFHKFGVDLYLCGHEHSYERLYPVYQGEVSYSYINPNKPTHLISGSAGCREHLEPFNGPKGPWSAFRSSTYGYGRLTVFNDTHIYWEQVWDVDGSVIDDMWLIQHNHGSFAGRE